MRLGIIGLPVAGKTTVFNALTGSNHPTGTAAGAARLEVRHGVAELADPRLEALSAALKPRKTTPLHIELGDVSGLPERGSISGELANELTKWEGLILVLRAFHTPLAAAPPAPQRDLELVEAEMLLGDQMRVESRLERLAADRQIGARDRAELDREQELFERLLEALGREQPLRALQLTGAEQRLLQGFGLLTLKPILVVQNLPEGQAATELQTGFPTQPLCGKLEQELRQLTAEEAADFRGEFGLEDDGCDQVLQAALQAMNLISFFTVGDPEARAWPLAAGGTALQAAGTIHSDMERGFIRAEVIAWDRLVALGDYPEARQAGELRAEGRDHVIADGDVVLVRFNV